MLLRSLEEGFEQLLEGRPYLWSLEVLEWRCWEPREKGQAQDEGMGRKELGEWHCQEDL